MCLSEKQANYVYKKVEEGKVINVNTLKKELEQDLDREDDNPYKKVVLNQAYRDEDKTPQVENWSIFTDKIKCIHQDERTPHRLDLHPLDYQLHKGLYCKLKGEEGNSIDIDFGHPDTLKTKYLDLYEDVYAEMVYTHRFDENSDLSTTYLGQTKMTRETKIKTEKSFPITGHGFTSGKLLDGTGCQIQLDTGATKSNMSKSFYLKCKCLHILPKFASRTQRIQVGNEQYVGVLFVIPVVIDIHRHRFKIYTLVSENHENVDLLLGIKNVFELEGMIDSCNSCFSFLNRSIPFFPKEKTEIPPKVQKMVIVEALFVEELSGMATIKVPDMNEHVTSMMKLKFIRNKVTLKITSNTNETVTFYRTHMIGILDLRYLGHFKVKQDILQKHLGKHYHFELAEDISAQFNRFVNLLKKEEESPSEKYPWLDDKDERKYINDREILDKYNNLDNSCLTKAEKKKVRDLIYKYKNAFSLRDEIGM